MKKLLILMLGSFIALSALADTFVNGYFKKNGTYVEGYYRTSPNSMTTDNYSSQGNTNPFTGTNGRKANDYTAEAGNYGGGQPIFTGPKGGQYYINEYGQKVYVRKQ